MTNPITKIDKQTVQLLLEEAGVVLAELAEKHGIRVVRKNCTFSETEIPVAFKFVVTQVDESGNAIDPREKEFCKNAHWFGLKADDFGKTFSTHEGTYEICGVKTRNRKFPILAKKVGTDKTYKFNEDVVKQALAQDALYGAGR